MCQHVLAYNSCHNLRADTTLAPGVHRTKVRPRGEHGSPGESRQGLELEPMFSTTTLPSSLFHFEFSEGSLISKLCGTKSPQTL